MTTEPQNPLSISRIQVNRLFGNFSYDLHGDGTDLSKLLILYGDNGCGKTTVLNCIFHLLSPTTNRGHRGALAKVPFSRFSVTLGDDTLISAERTGDNLTGSFEMSIQGPSTERLSRHFEFDANYKLQDSKGKTESTKLFAALQSLGLGLHFLSDERKIITDLGPDEEEDEPPHDVVHYMVTQRAARGAKNYLEQAIQRAVEAIRRQAIAGSGAGEINTNTLYADITKRIVSPYLRGTTVQDVRSLTNLIDDLTRQAERSISFARFGFSSELPSAELLPALQSKAAAERAEVLDQILRPYIDGFKLRLDALEPLHDKLSTFIDTINTFYSGKTVSFHLREGLLVTSETGQKLNPNVLSSGEKQLLLLFCNILAAGGKGSIFIIDEPELSLNVKWQRKLVRALLDSTRDSQTQFVLATHSLELLTQHQHNVLKFEANVPA